MDASFLGRCGCGADVIFLFFAGVSHGFVELNGLRNWSNTFWNGCIFLGMLGIRSGADVFLLLLASLTGERISTGYVVTIVTSKPNLRKGKRKESNCHTDLEVYI
jgi:hypothetical protein